MGSVESGRVLAGRYRLVTRLGRGGFGEVWRADDTVLGRQVAVKTLIVSAGDDDLLRRFEREAHALARLDHPNVVAVYDTGADDGTGFVVMQLLAGPSLAALVAERGPLPLAQALDYASQAAAGLAAAHAAGIVHRDVSPANLMLDGAGTLKLVDFGVARHGPRFDSADRDRHRVRNRRLCLPRTSSRAAGRRTIGPVLARLRALRPPRRRAAVHRRAPDRRRPAAADQPSTPPLECPRRRAGRARRAADNAAGQESGRQAEQRRRSPAPAVRTPRPARRHRNTNRPDASTGECTDRAARASRWTAPHTTEPPDRRSRARASRPRRAARDNALHRRRQNYLDHLVRHCCKHGVRGDDHTTTTARRRPRLRRSLPLHRPPRKQSWLRAQRSPPRRRTVSSTRQRPPISTTTSTTSPRHSSTPIPRTPATRSTTCSTTSTTSSRPDN